MRVPGRQPSKAHLRINRLYRPIVYIVQQVHACRDDLASFCRANCPLGRAMHRGLAALDALFRARSKHPDDLVVAHYRHAGEHRLHWVGRC